MFKIIARFVRERIWWKPQPSWKPVQTMTKKSFKFTKKITHVDDMMIHNLVKYPVQTRLRLWDIKITNFNKSCGQLVGLKFVIFISHKRSRVWTKYFYKIVYHYIICLCDFFREFIWFFLSWFVWVFMKIQFALDMFPTWVAGNLAWPHD